MVSVIKKIIILFVLAVVISSVNAGRRVELSKPDFKQSKRGWQNESRIYKEFGKRNKNRVRVIINLDLDTGIVAEYGDSRNWKKRIRLMQQMADIYSDKKAVLRHRFKNIPAMSADVDLNVYEILKDCPFVSSIEFDEEIEPHTMQGIPLIGGSKYRTQYDGTGVSIAICDTGIDPYHPALGGGDFPNYKVIGGWDVGDNDSNPNPQTKAHGTSCAGVAAGDRLVYGDYDGGVANGAKLYSMKITEGSTNSTYESDIMAAWDWCIEHQYDDPQNPIMIISTSFGGGRYEANCDSIKSSLRNTVASAKSAGITIFASSGNDGYCDAVSSPACLSGVISVGAVYDATFNSTFVLDETSCLGSPYIDHGYIGKVAAYSNSANMLDLLASSNNAYTTDIVGSGGSSGGNYYSGFGGTSAACPYAAGSGAVIQQASLDILGRFLTPNELKEYMVINGTQTVDSKNNISKPRVNIEAVIDALVENTLPDIDTLEVLGLNDLDEFTQSQYSCIVHYVDGTSENVTDQAVWLIDNEAFAIIDGSGLCIALQGDGNRSVEISADFRGYSVIKNVTIIDWEDKGISYSGGDGSVETPYIVSSTDQFLYLVNRPLDYFNNFALVTDVDLSGYYFVNSVFDGVFSGILDGRGHLVSNITIRDHDSLDMGFFDAIASSGMVLNLGLVNCNLSGGHIDGGAFVHDNSGSIERCFVKGSIEVDSGSAQGGFVAWNSGEIRNCYAMVDVSGGSSYQGGFVGYNFTGSITNCYSVGTVTGGEYRIGGFVGFNWNLVSDCFWDMDINGLSDGGGGTGLTSSAMFEANSFFNSGWDYVNDSGNGNMDIWFQRASEYPKLFFEAMDCDNDYNDEFNVLDIVIFTQEWLSDQNEVGESWRLICDYNASEKVDFFDYAIFAQKWLELE